MMIIIVKIIGLLGGMMVIKNGRQGLLLTV